MPCITITVARPAELVVTEVTADKYSVQPGESVTVRAKVVNRGGSTGTAYFDVYVNDAPQYMPKSATLGPNESTTLTWTLSFSEPGTYRVCVEPAVEAPI